MRRTPDLPCPPPAEGAAASPARRRTLLALAQRAERQPPGPLREALLRRHAHWAARAEAALPAAAGAGTAARPRAGAAALAALRAGLPSCDGPALLALQRADWSALRLARRLAEPLASEPPAQVGPLHAQALLPRALSRLQALAPGYLMQLLDQVDALAALADLAPPAGGEPAGARKGRGTRRR